MPVRDLAVELLEFVDDVVDELGSRRTWSTCTSPARGNERRPPARVHQASGGDMQAVVDHVADETIMGVPLPA